MSIELPPICTHRAIIVLARWMLPSGSTKKPSSRASCAAFMYTPCDVSISVHEEPVPRPSLVFEGDGPPLFLVGGIDHRFGRTMAAVFALTPQFPQPCSVWREQLRLANVTVCSANPVTEIFGPRMRFLLVGLRFKPLLLEEDPLQSVLDLLAVGQQVRLQLLELLPHVSERSPHARFELSSHSRAPLDRGTRTNCVRHVTHQDVCQHLWMPLPALPTNHDDDSA